MARQRCGLYLYLDQSIVARALIEAYRYFNRSSWHGNSVKTSSALRGANRKAVSTNSIPFSGKRNDCPWRPWKNCGKTLKMTHFLYAQYLFTILTAATFVEPSCRETLSDELNLAAIDETAERQMGLVGKWEKTSSSECDARYPERIEFFDRPRFLGEKGPGQSFIVWDAGGYQVLDKNQVKIQIATDEQVPYQFSVVGNILTFTDSEGCQFSYRRVE